MSAIRRNELNSIVAKFKDLEVFVVGDVILDHYIWGEVSRISPEAPVVVVNVNKEEYSLGGAANVAKNIVALGGKASLSGVIGEDRFATELNEQLAAYGVDGTPIVTVSDRSTTVKSRVIARSQQVVRVDRESDNPVESAVQQQIAAKMEVALQSANGVVVSDYAKGVLTAQTYQPLHDAYAAGKFKLNGRPLVVDPKNANFSLYKGASVVKPNRGEAEAASGMRIRSQDDAIAAGRKLLTIWQTDSVLVTLGELGMVSVSREEQNAPVRVPTLAREVYDVSGAGDTVAAVYCLSLAAGASVLQAAQLANIAAGVVVAEIGAVAITTAQLLDAIERAEGDV